MKTALDDDSFEFKVKVSPLPTPEDVLHKGSFLTFSDQILTEDYLTMSQAIITYSRISWETIGCIAAAWFILNAITLT